MAQEFSQKRYYDDDTVEGFVDVLRSCQVAIEFFLSHLLYGGDYSRVIWATDDIVFRRRVELVGNGVVKGGQKLPIVQTLALPFSNYNQSQDWEDDDRGYTSQAGQFVLGQYDEEFDATVRSAAVKGKFSTTSYFGRRDDLRLANQLAYWEQYLKYPFYFRHFVSFGKTRLAIPVNLVVEAINANPEYKEGDWLSKSKVFPMKVDLVVRTYEVLLRTVRPHGSTDDPVPVPLRFQNHHDASPDYLTNYPIVETTVLDFGALKFVSSEQTSANERAFYRAKRFDLMDAGKGYAVGDELEYSFAETKLVGVRVLGVDDEGAITKYTCDRAGLELDFQPQDLVETTGGSGTGALFRVETEKYYVRDDVGEYVPNRFTRGAIVHGEYEGTKEGAPSQDGTWTRDLLEGYFTPQYDVVFKSFGIERVPEGTLVDEGTGKPTDGGVPFDPYAMVKLVFDVQVYDDPLEYIDVLVHGRRSIRVNPPPDVDGFPPTKYHVEGSVLVTGLYQDSGYDTYVVVHFASGERAMASLKASVFRTLRDERPVYRVGEATVTEEAATKAGLDVSELERLPVGPVGPTEAPSLPDVNAATVPVSDLPPAPEPTHDIHPEPAGTPEAPATIALDKRKRGVRPGTGDDPLIGFEWDN